MIMMMMTMKATTQIDRICDWLRQAPYVSWICPADLRGICEHACNV